MFLCAQYVVLYNQCNIHRSATNSGFHTVLLVLGVHDISYTAGFRILTFSTKYDENQWQNNVYTVLRHAIAL